MNASQERLLWLLSYSRARGDAKSFPADWTIGEWAAVSVEAERHGLAPMLHHRLSRLFPAGSVPAPAFDRLQRSHRLCAVKNFARFRALAPVLCGLRKAGIPVIVLKGAFLAAVVYENIALRPMMDVDLLLDPRAIPETDAILLAAGFRRLERAATVLPELNEFHYQHESGPFRIETHWELFAPDYPFRFALGEMWRTAVPACIAGIEVMAFNPEDQLIHLASHAAIHRFEFGLRPLVDLAEVVRRLGVNWPLLSARAVAQRTGRAVGIPLALAGELLGVEVPAAVTAELGVGAMPPELFAEARETVLLNARGRRAKGEPNPNLILFFGRRGWRDRLALARSRLFPSRRALAALYPVDENSPWIWLCYPRRFAFILSRNLRGLWTITRRIVGRSSGRAGELMDWMLH